MPTRREDWYTPLWRAGVALDVVRPDDPELDRYELVLAPSLYLVTEASAASLARFAERVGTLAVGFHSGMVDENAHGYLGGYPGAFRDVLGVVTDELFPLLPGETTGLTGDVASGATADLWSERIRLTGAQAVASHADGPLTGHPAVTSTGRAPPGIWAPTRTRTRSPLCSTASVRRPASHRSATHPPGSRSSGAAARRPTTCSSSTTPARAPKHLPKASTPHRHTGHRNRHRPTGRRRRGPRAPLMHLPAVAGRSRHEATASSLHRREVSPSLKHPPIRSMLQLSSTHSPLTPSHASPIIKTSDDWEPP